MIDLVFHHLCRFFHLVLFQKPEPLKMRTADPTGASLASDSMGMLRCFTLLLCSQRVPDTLIQDERITPREFILFL